MRQTGFYLALKKAADRVAAVGLLVGTAPVLCAAAVGIRMTMGAPVLFTQARGGYRGSRFQIYKFRTMTLDRDENGNLLPDGQRLTRLGSFLRRFSIDELPQLLNVLRGELSLVGPRPLIADYLSIYNPEQARRHDVLPGITGWTQVNGRNSLTWEQRFELDVWYVDHWSLGLDARILLRTVTALFDRRGIASEGEATSPYFRGTPAASTPKSSQA